MAERFELVYPRSRRVHVGELDAAREAEARLEALRDEVRAAGEDRHATYIDVDRQILASWIWRVEGEPDEAVRLIHAVAELEEIRFCSG